MLRNDSIRTMMDPGRIKDKVSDLKRLMFERKHALTAQPHPHPVLIFGNQKSGTSAIAGLLGQATDQRVQSDFRGAWEPFLTPLVRGDTSIDRFVRKNAWAFSAPIIKEPGLTFVAHRLLCHFPDSPCVFILRNPVQNIRSILDRLGLRGDQDRLPRPRDLPNRTWVSVLSGTDLGLTGTLVEIQALRWLRAVAEYERDPTRFVLIRYEDFVADKESAIADLARKVGLQTVASIVATKDDAFQKPGNSTVDPVEFFGPVNLERVQSLCGEKMRAFCYGDRVQ